MRITATLLALFAAAHADAAMVKLQNVGPTTGAYRWTCAPTGFIDDSHIAGACREMYYYAGSGRGGGYVHPRLLGTWLVSWDYTGVATLNPDLPVDWPTCTTYTTVTIDGVKYYLLGADALGNQLVETSGCQGYLVTP